MTDEGKQWIKGKILEGGKQKRSEIICLPQIRKNELEAPLPAAMVQPVVRNTKLIMLRPTYTTAKKDKTQKQTHML